MVPESAPVAKLTQALSFGATVLAVRGSYDDAFDLCLAASEEFGWFNRSTGYNPFTREGKKSLRLGNLGIARMVESRTGLSSRPVTAIS